MKDIAFITAFLLCLGAAPAMASSVTERVRGCETYVNDAGQVNLVQPGCLGRTAGGRANTPSGGKLPDVLADLLNPQSKCD